MNCEQGIIGCLLIENCIDRIPYIKEGMFTDDLYRAIFIEYKYAYENNNEIDEIYLRWALEDKCPLETLNEVLLTCINGVSTSMEITTYAKILYKQYQAREAELRLQNTPIKAQTAEEDIRKVIDELESLITDKGEESHSMAELSEMYKDSYFCEKANQGVKLGINSLDEMVGALEGGDVIVLGARPSVGKSALMVQIATNMVKQGFKVGFFNMEMQDKQIYERFISHLSGLGLTRIRRAIKYTDDEQERFDKANKTLKEDFKNLVISTGSKTMSEVRAECRNRGYDVIIIDYLQLITPESSYRGNRFAEVGEISRKIKGLAMELNVPIIALSQLNRVSEQKETKEPTMGELRESGNVEQDASVIILMWNLNEERTEKGIKVDKNRQGKVGTIKMEFDGAMMRFEEIGESHSDDFEDTEDNPFI